MSRRQFLNSVLAAAGGLLGSLALPAAFASAPWPAEAEWQKLGEQVGGRLVAVESPLRACVADPAGVACTAALKDMENPFFLEDHPGATQTSGWMDAWTAAVSPYAVAAEHAQDVVAAVNFSRRHGVRLVVKGTGHDYLGRSNAPRSLLVWTHRMRDVVVHNDFRILGGPRTAPVSAISVAAGARWLEVYVAAAQHGLYVQGGGCTSVGAAGGFIQGSGFGSFSKTYGTGAAGALEFEVVTADGKVRIANAARNADLFWALRGGGGGTFGIVTRVTLRAHPMPQTVGLLDGTVKAHGDEEFRALLRQFARFYPALNNPHWGEQIGIGHGDNMLGLNLTFLDLSEAAARATWQPFLAWLAARPQSYTVAVDFRATSFASLWDAAWWRKNLPGFVVPDPRAGQPATQYWWSSNQAEVSAWIRSFQSRWLPVRCFDEPDALGDALYEASRQWYFTLHFNKGLSGATLEALEQTRATCLHMAAFDAAALIIVASHQPHAFPGVPGHEPDVTAGKAAADGVRAAMKILRTLTPKSGTYANEADYFEPDWQDAFWGAHYPRLLAIKRKYDPTNLFCVHHGVGSEGGRS